MSGHKKHTPEQYDVMRAMRLAREQGRRKRKPDPVRRKGWLPYDLADPAACEEITGPEIERVMPRGERERRRTVVAVALAEVEGTREPGQAVAPAGAGQHGVVVEVASGLCRVDLGEHLLLCALHSRLSARESGLTNVVAVGDEVLAEDLGAGRGLVTEILPRRSALRRPDVFHSHLQQVVAANVDQLLIVAAWREPAFWPELLDRYLIAAERSGLAALIAVNKIDLAEDAADGQTRTSPGVQTPSPGVRAAVAPYQELGYRVILASAVTGEGVAELRQALQGRTTALAGLSGVGKSSLLKAVQPGLELRIGAVSERRHEGRHTTTQVTLWRLEMGGLVVDTPGIREFGLAGLHRAELARYYPEIAAAQGGCRFADCSHTGEPGCAVRAAVQAGRIAAVRYDSYRKIYLELPTQG